MERDCNTCDRHTQGASISQFCAMCLQDKRTNLPFWKLDETIKEEYLRKLEENQDE